MQAGGQYYAPNVWSPPNAGCRTVNIEINAPHQFRTWLHHPIPGLDYQRPVFQYAGGRDYESAQLLGSGNIIQRNGFSADRPVEEAGQDYGAGEDYRLPEATETSPMAVLGKWTEWTTCSSGQKFKERYKHLQETLSCNPPIGPNPNHKTCPKKLPKVGSSCQLTQFGRKCGYQWSSCCGEYIAGWVCTPRAQKRRGFFFAYTLFVFFQQIDQVQWKDRTMGPSDYTK